MAEAKEKLIPRLRRKHPWLDHLFRAGQAFGERYGNHYAAAITYFSVLSLFPLLLVGFSIAGFVLAGNQAALDQLRSGIVSSVPGGLSGLINDLINTAINSRGTTGILGLVLALYSGVGWMTNLRDALTAQWGQEKKKLPLISTTLKDLLALVGLGMALVLSFGLTAVGGGIGRWLLKQAGLADQGWAAFVLTVITVVLSLTANTLVFLWVLSRLPREHVSVRSAAKGAVMAAVGFEILKQVGSIYLSSVLGSPIGVLIGPIIGLLVFANLVSRFVLFVTAWTATASENIITVVEPPPPAVIRPLVPVRRGLGAGSVAGAFGAGAFLAWLGRRRG
ncbi:inner membrane protein YhjD [Amycolatopsis rhizosphaerae]|uniref:Inner membrane protein YhjD n=1 Tax=Amycolatopsis rhizosphaerae TaxID=2053003 RepID=A0A558A3R9_9PSEU|nr:inner membrane protein YhjD [Amycolatopsis rhizosphaerae]TVT18876.1 inner membrane protein YhjD [Amycolatopsis rhizosphaerae]